MIPCPDCGYENLDGEELCARCEQPLVPTAASPSASSPERDILQDPIRRLVPREPFLVAPETPVGEVLPTQDLRAAQVSNGDIPCDLVLPE